MRMNHADVVRCFVNLGNESLSAKANSSPTNCRWRFSFSLIKNEWFAKRTTLPAADRLFHRSQST